MFFGSPDGKMAKSNGLSFPQPALVFVVNGHTLSVRALKTNQRPSADTKLYVAPTGMSATAGASVSARRVFQHPFHRAIPQWERAFFESEFTHPNGPTSDYTQGGFAGLWESWPAKTSSLRYLVEATKYSRLHRDQSCKLNTQYTSSCFASASGC